MKNPGVLCNSPAGLEKCTDKEILDAADLGAPAASASHACPHPKDHRLAKKDLLVPSVRAAGWLRADGRALGALPARRAVATLDANKPVINALLGLVLILVLAAGLYRASVVNPTGAIAGFDESGAPMMRKQAPR